MPQMTKIISTKPFSPVDFTINPRNAGNDIGCFMRVSELGSIKDGFSWTDKIVQVFLSVIDHTKLAEFYDKQNEKKKGIFESFSKKNPKKFKEFPPKYDLLNDFHIILKRWDVAICERSSFLVIVF